MRRLNHIRRFTYISLLIGGGILSIGNSNSYVISNINNSVITFLDGSSTLSTTFQSAASYFYYKSLGSSDTFSTSDLTYDSKTRTLSRSLTNPTFIKSYLHKADIDLTLGFIVRTPFDWRFVAAVRTYQIVVSSPESESRGNWTFIPELYVVHDSYGSLGYRNGKLSDSESLRYEISLPRELIADDNFGGSYIKYSSPKLSLKNENRFWFNVVTSIKPRTSSFYGTFAESLDRYALKTRSRIYVDSHGPTEITIDKNYYIDVHYDQTFKSLHNLSLDASYIRADYFTEPGYYLGSKNYTKYDDTYHFVFGKAREHIFKTTLGYSFGTFKIQYMYGITRANNSDQKSIIGFKEGDKDAKGYHFDPIMLGSSHSIRLYYSPYSFNKKLRLKGVIDMYSAQVTENGGSPLISLGKSNVALSNVDRNKYSFSIKYQLSDDFSFELKNSLHIYTDKYKVTSGGTLINRDVLFESKLSLTAGF